MTKVYWTNSKNQQIDVDSMDENYLRNTLKMIITGKTKSGSKFDINKHLKRKEIKTLHGWIDAGATMFNDDECDATECDIY